MKAIQVYLLLLLLLLLLVVAVVVLLVCHSKSGPNGREYVIIMQCVCQNITKKKENSRRRGNDIRCNV